MSNISSSPSAIVLGAVTTLTGNSGGAVSPTLGNIDIVGSGGVTVTGNPGTSTLTITGDGLGVTTLAGNTGTASASTVNVIADTAEGTSVITGDNVDTLTLTFTDDDLNVVIGTSDFVANHTLGVAQTNVGIGWHVLNSITDGGANFAAGFDALASVTTGSENCGIGTNALNSLTTGDSNIAIYAGINALVSGSDNIAIGGTSGSNYTTSESSNILINNVGVIGESHKMRIGTSGSGISQVNATYIAGIDSVNVGSVSKVVTMASGQLGTATITAGTGITITPTANVITIAATGTTNLTYTGVVFGQSPYTVLSTDEYISCDLTGGAITIRLPNAATSGRAYVIKDRLGLAAGTNITVTTVGGAVNIDGAVTYVMNAAYQAINVIGNGSTYEIY
jgi:hypothetical protein